MNSESHSQSFKSENEFSKSRPGSYRISKTENTELLPKDATQQLPPQTDPEEEEDPPCWTYYTLGNLIRRQHITVPEGEEAEGPNTGLKRELSVAHLIAYGVASMVGAGIFVTSGIAIKEAGSGVIIGFLISGFAALLSALCYAEYAARLPVSGSAYTFVYVTLGELLAFIVGWNMTLEYAVSASAVAQGWAGYVIQLLDQLKVHPPAWMHGLRLTDQFTFSPLALSIIVLCTIALFGGVKESAVLNIVVTSVNVAIIIFIVILGALNVNVLNWENFFANANGNSPSSAVLAAAGTVFFSFIGFDSITTLAGEVKNPKKAIPFSIVVTLGVVTTLYCAVATVLTGMVTYNSVNIEAPLAMAFRSKGLHWAATIIASASITTLTATTLASLLGQPRVFYQMSVDGLFFSPFQRVNSSGVLTFGTIITGVLAGILALFLDLNSLTQMISAGTLLAYGAVASGIIVLRYRVPQLGETGGGKDSSSPIVIVYSRIPSLQKASQFLMPHVPKLLLLYIVVATGLGFCLRENVPYYFNLLFVVVLIAIYISIQILEQQNVPSSFMVPLVPLTPLLAITINIFLITRLPADALIRLIVWSALGAGLYLAYGIRNSNLNWAYTDHYKPKIIPNDEVTSMSDNVNEGGEPVDDSTWWKDDDE